VFSPTTRHCCIVQLLCRLFDMQTMRVGLGQKVLYMYFLSLCVGWAPQCGMSTFLWTMLNKMWHFSMSLLKTVLVVFKILLCLDKLTQGEGAPNETNWELNVRKKPCLEGQNTHFKNVRKNPRPSGFKTNWHMYRVRTTFLSYKTNWHIYCEKKTEKCLSLI
jgi:hypothetical protein